MSKTDSPTPASHDAAATPVSSTERARLDRSLAHGVAWMGSVKWITQLLTWVSTIFVARLLSPADYGLVGLATMYLGIVTLLSEFGIGTTIVAMRGLSPSQVAQINTASLLFGAASFAVSCAVAPLLAAFFDAPQLTAVIIAMASIFLITSARTVPQAILQREMRFRDLAINDGVQALLLAAGSVTFAALGFRYWTLVISAVLGALISTIGVLRLVRVPFERPHVASLADAIRFSRHTIVGRIAWYVHSNADFFIAGKLLGKDALGVYRFGWDLADAPVQKLTSMIARVTPSILSAVQRDRDAVRRYLLGITESIALVTFPATIGLALVTPDLVPWVLGAKWIGIIVPMQILAVVAALRSIAPILAQVLTAARQNHRTMQVNILGALLLPPAFWFASRWGIIGIASAWLVAYPLVIVLPMFLVAAKETGLRPADYLRALRAPLTGVAAMCLAVLLMRRALPLPTPRSLALMLTVALGAVTYGATILLLHGDRVRAIVAKVRGVQA